MRLTERDLACFKEFRDLGCLTARQLTELSLFPNEKKARDRMKLLQGEEFIKFCARPHFGAGRAEHVYYLNKKKIDEVVQLLGCPREEVCIMKPSAYAPLLLHHLAINDFIIHIRQACKQSGVYEVEIIPEYKHLPDKSNKLKQFITQNFSIKGIATETIPDGIICLTHHKQKGKTLLFFEIYRGTQTIQGGENCIQHKLEAYVIYWEQESYASFSDLFSYSFKGFRVLLIVNSVSYLEKLKNICSQIGAPSGLFWLALSRDIMSKTIFKSIWHVPGKEGLKAIVNHKEGMR